MTITARPSRIIPRTNVMQRPGLDGALVRVTTVFLDANAACSGGSLHEVHGVRVLDGRPVYWFATETDVRKWGWVV